MTDQNQFSSSVYTVRNEIHEYSDDDVDAYQSVDNAFDRHNSSINPDAISSIPTFGLDSHSAVYNHGEYDSMPSYDDPVSQASHQTQSYHNLFEDTHSYTGLSYDQHQGWDNGYGQYSATGLPGGDFLGNAAPTSPQIGEESDVSVEARRGSDQSNSTLSSPHDVVHARDGSEVTATGGRNDNGQIQLWDGNGTSTPPGRRNASGKRARYSNRQYLMNKFREGQMRPPSEWGADRGSPQILNSYPTNSMVSMQFGYRTQVGDEDLAEDNPVWAPDYKTGLTKPKGNRK